MCMCCPTRSLVSWAHVQLVLPACSLVSRQFSPMHACACRRPSRRRLRGSVSASPKPHPSKPHPCNMPEAKTEVALQFSECCAAEVALQHSLFCSVEVISTKSCAAANEKPHCNFEKAALQESGSFLPLSCGFQAPTFRHPRLGLADSPEVLVTRQA